MALAPTHEDKRMTCMEVWGGSDAVNAAVTLSGLDAWVYSKPYGENAAAGGDVYYVSACATGRINRLLVADVAGHGAAVREIAINLRDLMRRFVNYLDQAKFVSQMNARFLEASADSVFATAIVTTFFAPTRTLSVCNAGHPPPLIYRVADRKWSLLECGDDREHTGNIPLGIMEMDHCEQFDVELRVGDLVLVYTDSLIEATDPSREMMGVAGLLRLINEIEVPADRKSLVPELLAEIDRRTSGGLQADDVTALLISANGSGTRTGMLVRFMAPFRLLGGIVNQLRGKGPAGIPDWSLANVGGAIFGPLSRARGKRH
jgi:sigma-B regulation protein RsbU (phosphoserine phosphatase)